METQHYHNTTNQNTEFVLSAKKKNKSQEEIVFGIFLKYKKLSASEVLEHYPSNVPLTSIRRAISNIQYQGKLRKLAETKIGLYDAPEHYYAVVTPEDKQYTMNI